MSATSGEGGESSATASDRDNKTDSTAVGEEKKTYHGSVVGRRRNDNLFSATDEMGLCLVGSGKNTGGLDDIVSTSFTPLDVLGLHGRVDGDGVAVDNELAVLGLDGALEAAVCGVVLCEVDHVVEVDEGVVDCDDLDLWLLQRRAEDDAANATVTVDADLDDHCEVSVR